jgi:hypothetical protein
LTVFLRWGAFALLAIAALVYSYRVNERAPAIAAQLEANKQAARERTARAQAANGDSASDSFDRQGSAQRTDADRPECSLFIQAASAGAAAAERGEPLDRALRESVIAWEENAALKQALASTATEAYQQTSRSTQGAATTVASAACESYLRPPTANDPPAP